VNTSTFSSFDQFSMLFWLEAPGQADLLSLSLTGLSDLNGAPVQLTVNLEGPIAAVSEPQTCAMLFAGLALLGFQTRRQRERLRAA